ncbi:DUF4912 domain-containing protein [Synechococcus sp. PCC 7336]|uniref:DUF4912 domain-containing protein n=1 Tax=Synechococcus sp. PCC 7336 TaxID=195250 RepID=UPI000346B3F4|nr:DUF4912 domain-containing protein [Synechococcus sp. PCC 7336]
MSTERPPLEAMTLRELRVIASKYSVSRYSRMRKEELLQAIQDAEAKFSTSNSQVAEPVSQDTVSASKFSVGGVMDPVTLSDVDADLGELPGGYGTSRIVLLPRDPQWAYTYWDIPNEHKEDLRRQGGQQLALRMYDVTDLDFYSQGYHNLQEYPCDELAREWYLPIPVSDRSYIVEIGYRCADGRWLKLATSAAVTIPPTYPSDWIEDIFVTVPFDMDLNGKTIYKLREPYKRAAGMGAFGPDEASVTAATFKHAGGLDSQHVAGSLFGSRQMVPEETVSSFVFPSGAGMAAAAPWMASGSGLGLFSGASESLPQRSRKFWLVADAELIVYGATEPDATVTVAGRKIELNPDGTFRFHMAFPDGNIDFPIFAVAADGEQNREIHLTFDRDTLSRRTNTKAEAVEEFF